jgi:hypothetical protein
VFYKHTRLEKKLREGGRSAPAEILSMRTEGSGHSGKRTADEDLTQGWTLARLDLRVMPDGEPPFEVTVRSRLNTAKWKGDSVPVLYDPDDHDKVVVDYEADARETMERIQQERTDSSDFNRQANEFADQAAAFRRQSESMLGNSEKLAALARAKAAGDQAEVERLKAEITKPD